MKNDLKLINSFNFMGIVFKKDSPLEIYHLINKYEYLERQSINKWFFYFIPESEINEEIFKYLVDFLNNSDNYFEFLLPEKYLKFNDNKFNGTGKLMGYNKDEELDYFYEGGFNDNKCNRITKFWLFFRIY